MEYPPSDVLLEKLGIQGRKSNFHSLLTFGIFIKAFIKRLSVPSPSSFPTAAT